MQLYDFSPPKECPNNIVFHPHYQMFACGFKSGYVRVFNVTNTSLVVEHRLHEATKTMLPRTYHCRVLSGSTAHL